MADEQRIPRDHRNPRGQRGHRQPGAGRPELRAFLRTRPLVFRRPEAPAVEAPQPKEAKAAKGPRVSAPSARKLAKLDVRSKRRSNRGAYSGQ